MKILAFAASSSKKSINKRLVTYAASLLQGADVEVLDLNDFEMPLFSVDKEEELGHPALAKAFLSKIAASDALIISFAEHNGSYSAAYKNLFDWCSRAGAKVFHDKPLVLLATSQGRAARPAYWPRPQLPCRFLPATLRPPCRFPAFLTTLILS